MVVKLAEAGLRETDNCLLACLRASYKADEAANEEAVVIKFALPYTVDFFF
jgi:hypothetical protein